MRGAGTLVAALPSTDVRVLLFGASGMVGQGVLRECLASPEVAEVLCVGRRKLDVAHPKLRQVVQADVTDLSSIRDELGSFAACFFPLGVSSAGMEEDEYRRLTYDLTMAIASQLALANPRMTFVYVSGAGTDSSGKGRSMWARVKGKTENDLLALFPNAYMFRPGLIRPMDGIVSRTPMYRRLYVVLSPFVALVSKVAPDSMNTTRTVGQAMLSVARHGFPKKVLAPKDINAAARRLPAA
jgi:uncharacterized protein YbjT (DUF2867 family)